MRTKIASRAIIGAALTLALTGCFKIDMDITVNPNDTVDGTFIFGLERGAADLLSMSEDEIMEELERDFTSDLPEGGRVEPYTDERFVGTKVTLDDVSLDELNEGSGTGDLSITRQGDTYVAAGQLDLTEEELNAGGLEGFEELADTVEAQVRITFPGEVTETNGELSNEDRTVTWHPQVGEVNEISAVADADSSGGVPGWVWPLGGIAAIVVAGLVLLNMRKREPVTETVDGRVGDNASTETGSETAGWTTPPAATRDQTLDADRADDAETRDLAATDTGTASTVTATTQAPSPTAPRPADHPSAPEEPTTVDAEELPETRPSDDPPMKDRPGS